MGTRSRILVVDDHPVVCEGVANILLKEPDLEYCGSGASVSEGLDAIAKFSPDLCIVDINLGANSGLDLIKSLDRSGGTPKVLVSSMHDEYVYARRALRAGAQGYISKSEMPERLLFAIRRVLLGNAYLTEAMQERRRIAAASDVGAAPDGSVENLSDRELQVFECIGQGIGSRDIAERLCISVKTVETHRQNIKRKLSVETAPELACLAVEWAVTNRSR